MNAGPALRGMTARRGADGSVTASRHLPSASEFPPDCAHPEAYRRPASRPTRSRARLQRHAALQCESSTKPFCLPPSIMRRRNAMPTTTVTTPSAAETPFHRAGSLTSTGPVKDKPEAPRMVRLTVNLPSHLVEQMRDAVYWTPGLTLAWLIARAVRASLTELETIHQGPFPKRAKPLRAGRPRLLGQSMNVHPDLSGHSIGNSPQDTCQHQAPSIRPIP